MGRFSSEIRAIMIVMVDTIVTAVRGVLNLRALSLISSRTVLYHSIELKKVVDVTNAHEVCT